jgi:hypothetical protein
MAKLAADMQQCLAAVATRPVAAMLAEVVIVSADLVAGPLGTSDSGPPAIAGRVRSWRWTR